MPAPDWITGYIDTPIARIPVISTDLNSHDKADGIKVRLGIGRDDCKVPTGLYAAGKPDNTSPVLVTANYKLTFDCLRSALPGLNACIYGTVHRITYELKPNNKSLIRIPC